MCNHDKWIKMIYDIPKTSLTDFSSPAVFKATCSALAFHGNYATGADVHPSWTTVAKKAGVSRTTAYKVRDWLLENQWLEQTGTTEANIAVYSLREGVVQSEWTTDQQESQVETALSVVQSEQTTETEADVQSNGAVVHSAGAVVQSDTEQLSTQSGHNTKELILLTTDTTKNTKEQRLPTPTAAVDVDDVPSSPLLSLVEDDSPLPPNQGGTPCIGEDIKDNDHEEEEWKTNREQALEGPERNDPTEDTPEPTEAGREKMSHVPDAPQNDHADLQNLAEQYAGMNKYVDLEELLEEARTMIADGYRSSTTNLILDAKDNLSRRVALEL